MNASTLPEPWTAKPPQSKHVPPASIEQAILPPHRNAQVRQMWQALALWGIFFVLLVLLNATIPFLLGGDVRAWTFSPAKGFLLNLLVYGGICLGGPLLLYKGWKTVHQPGFLAPLLVAVLALLLRGIVPALVSGILVVLGYLHWRYNLVDLGMRSRGWRGDALAIGLLGVLSLIPALLSAGPHTLTLGAALSAGLTRWFANPASTAENLFYFGLLTERLTSKTGRWFTPLVIAAMYTAHEMSNPEYWYSGKSFVLIFVSIAVMATLFMWRRSMLVTWLGDGLSRFVSQVFM